MKLCLIIFFCLYMVRIVRTNTRSIAPITRIIPTLIPIAAPTIGLESEYEGVDLVRASVVSMTGFSTTSVGKIE